jgi:hypothetical protein
MVHFFDDFLGDTINLDLYVVNVSSGGTAFAINAQHNGVIRGTGDGTDGDITNLYCPPQYRADAGGPLTLEIRATLITSLANGEEYIGFSDAATDENPINVSTADVVTTTASNAVGFAFTGAGTADWKAVSVNGDADGTVTRCNVGGATTPVLTTWQTFKVVINADGDADYYIDGIFQVREDLAVSPTTLLNFFVAQQDGGAARSTDLDYIEVWAGRR